MPDVRKTPPPGTSQGVVYDLAAARARTVAPAPEGADVAGFSGQALELARANTVVRESPETRAEKIRALRARIEAGEYRPDPREIARRIIAQGL
ncbi:MAG: flagellar biosynthesis anti-sigma factor FlgM [Dehalococcoidia bacterium]|nr:MAG: flagellar biosynthesis anti-sigma factor FlgM [bacterium]MCE7929502.1 flagellar biosynthesis anti-sigma factor FlgM [Chloroflexi bacterium CFX7]MCL4230598.1 flagellar biosynthesis anti-sigma factor FlgM [Dehalococcoidia bacterium]NUQ55705.1 flagellar biosynthesis anti-sigma factor FlgM [Dehalococcoidia bacterium]